MSSAQASSAGYLPVVIPNIIFVILVSFSVYTQQCMPAAA
jgi:hypothetical protein